VKSRGRQVDFSSEVLETSPPLHFALEPPVLTFVSRAATPPLSCQDLNCKLNISNSNHPTPFSQLHILHIIQRELSQFLSTIPQYFYLLQVLTTDLIMANYLASIFGTEQDKVNCSFYYKIGACRHGDRCSRKHVKPSYSQTILLPNLYQNPAYDPKNKMNASQLQNHFDAFYEDFWCEMCKYGEIEEVVVCDNNNDRTSPFKSTLCGCVCMK
jgi:hypothetical protein